MSKEWSKEIFSRNLRKYMSQSNINQKELAKIIGVSAPTFNGYFKGETFPRIDKIQKLADYFGVLKSDLIEDKSIKERDNGKISDAVIRMKVDSRFLDVVVELQRLDGERLDSILTLIKSFSNNSKN